MASSRFFPRIVPLFFLGLVILAGGLSAPALATTYYVSTGGSNGNNGLTTLTPWATLHYSIPLLAANDTLIVMPGTYDLSHEGSATNLTISQNNVTIQGQSPSTAIIDGASASTWVYGITVTGSTVTIQQLNITRFQTAGIYLNGCSGATVQYLDVSDNGTAAPSGTGIVLFGTTSAYVYNNTIYWTGNASFIQNRGIVAASSTDNTNIIHSNSVYGHDGPAYAGIEVGTGTAPIVSENTINNNETGIRLNDTTSTVRRNLVYDNTTGIHVAATSSSTPSIWNNMIKYSAGPATTGILVEQLSAGTAAPLVYHNTVDGMTGPGVHATNGGSSPLIRYNIVTNSGVGISSTAGATPTLRYNNVYNCTTAYNGIGAGVGDTSVDPNYVNPGSDWHLQAGSPCIDAIPTGEADPVSDDKDGAARPSGSGFDQGCYEDSGGGGGGASYSVSFPPGTTADKYMSRSVPLEPGDPSVPGAFGPQIGFYDITLMRIGSWDSDIQGYVEYPGNGKPLEPGKAIWFLFRYGQTITFSGTPTSTSADPKDSQQAAQVALNVGWNQVGNPFTHPVAIANMVISNADGTPTAEDLTDGTLSQGIFWVYESGVYYTTAKLAAAEGGWVKKYNENGYLWVKDITVPYPDPAPGAPPEARGLSLMPDDYDRPPAPPGGGGGSGWSSSGGGGGGGGGGCFIQTLY
jgi:parallel beta-helix repeat protein